MLFPRFIEGLACLHRGPYGNPYLFRMDPRSKTLIFALQIKGF